RRRCAAGVSPTPSASPSRRSPPGRADRRTTCSSSTPCSSSCCARSKIASRSSTRRCAPSPRARRCPRGRPPQHRCTSHSGGTTKRASSCVASPRLDALPFDGTRVQTLARLALLASALGEREVAGVLHAELAPYADDDVVIGAGVAWLGPVAPYLGVLALTMGRVDEAVARLEDALARSRRSAAPAQVAHVQAVL